MNIEYKLDDVKADGFMHSRIYDVNYDPEEKIFKANFGFADLKKGGALIDCSIIITDWWDLEVIQYRGDQIIGKFRDYEVPELDSIVHFKYDENMLILEDLCGPDEIYHFKFAKPKIQITGIYDPD